MLRILRSSTGFRLQMQVMMTLTTGCTTFAFLDVHVIGFKIPEYERGKKEIVGRRHFPRFKLSMRMRYTLLQHLS
jgi:hypothetical protein